MDLIVELIDLQPNCTNVVICRHRNLLFARSIPLGSRQLQNDEMISKLAFELTGCKRHFASMYRKNQIDRAIFLAPGHKPGTEGDICVAIAKQLDMPAQIGDCIAAIEIQDPYECGIDRRGCQINWATAFGLSLP
jgi:hypothetical protein